MPVSNALIREKGLPAVLHERRLRPDAELTMPEIATRYPACSLGIVSITAQSSSPPAALSAPNVPQAASTATHTAICMSDLEQINYELVVQLVLWLLKLHGHAEQWQVDLQ